MEGASNIVLVGPMGAGKSVAGALLARRLGLGFVDVDAAVEAEAGARIGELFRRDGEAAFRARETAALANSLDGLELLVFTGGIGEHAAPIRAMVASRLRWLGVRLDPAANAEAAERIDARQSAVEIRIIPADEELAIARHTAALAAEAGA